MWIIGGHLGSRNYIRQYSHKPLSYSSHNKKIFDIFSFIFDHKKKNGSILNDSSGFPILVLDEKDPITKDPPFGMQTQKQLKYFM